MKSVLKLLLPGLGFVTLASIWLWPGAAQPNKTPLTSEQLQVYGDFVDSLAKMNFKFVANKTFPLDLSNLPNGAACLQGIQLEAREGWSKETHLLEHPILRGHQIKFVGEVEESTILNQRDSVAASGGDAKKDTLDPKIDPGVLELSEIAFDKSHKFAVLRYVFLCGSHCNSGATLVLEKVDSKWVGTTRRPCSFLVNADSPRR